MKGKLHMQSFNLKSTSLARLAVQAMTAGALILSSLALRADDAQANQNKLDAKEAAFIKETARAGHMEVKMGQIGKDQGQSSEIKQLGERIVKDHTKANEELTAIASNKGVDLASDASKHAHDDMNKLNGKSGADFDKAYAEHMIRDHKKDIAKFEKASRECKDTELKAFIDKTLPTLRQHLEQATAAGRSVGLDEKTLSSFDQENDAAGSAATGETGVSTPSQDPILLLKGMQRQIKTNTKLPSTVR
jgi:putative membrane protein